MEKLNKKPIEALEKQIDEVEKKINKLIKKDNSLSHLFSVVTSVEGVGSVVFWEMIITTNERPAPGSNFSVALGSLPVMPE